MEQGVSEGNQQEPGGMACAGCRLDRREKTFLCPPPRLTSKTFGEECHQTFGSPVDR